MLRRFSPAVLRLATRGIARDLMIEMEIRRGSWFHLAAYMKFIL